MLFFDMCKKNRILGRFFRMILIFNGRSCLPCTALPYSRNGCVPARGTPFYVRTISSVWGHFGCFTRSAFRRTPSLNKTHFWVMGSWCGVPSVVSRSSLDKIRQGTRKRKETTILIKRTFWRLGVLWSFLGPSLVLPWSFTRSTHTRNKGRES